MWQNIKFQLARWNGKKIPIYITVIAFLIWLFLPTGDPTDVLITLPLLKVLGFKIFVAIAVILLIIFFANGKVRKMFKHPTTSEIQNICKKITDTKKDYRKCLVQH